MEKTKAKVTKLEYEEISIDNDYENEKDVEERIIKPFLKDDLGYNVNDYVQQLNVPIVDILMLYCRIHGMSLMLIMTKCMK